VAGIAKHERPDHSGLTEPVFCRKAFMRIGLFREGNLYLLCALNSVKYLFLSHVHFLKTNGNFYVSHRGKSNQAQFKQYKTKACNECRCGSCAPLPKTESFGQKHIHPGLWAKPEKTMYSI